MPLFCFDICLMSEVYKNANQYFSCPIAALIEKSVQQNEINCYGYIPFFFWSTVLSCMPFGASYHRDK